MAPAVIKMKCSNFPYLWNSDILYLIILFLVNYQPPGVTVRKN